MVEEPIDTINVQFWMQQSPNHCANVAIERTKSNEIRHNQEPESVPAEQRSLS
jgi:hypothetical protein